MAFTRQYREGMDPARVRAILHEHAGAQWDDEIVEALLRVVDRRDPRARWSLDDVGRDAAPAPTIGCDCLPTLVGA